MNIVIVDDEQKDRQDVYENVQECLHKYLQDEDYNIYTFLTPQDFIASLDSHIYDLAYLDIELNDINGIDLAAILKEENPHCLITFITNYDQYVQDAFILDVVQYLEKPIQKDDFEKNFLNTIQLYRNRNFKLLFHTDKGNTILRTKEIIYVETYYRQIKIVTLNDIYYTNIKQKENLQKILKTLHFIKVHRSFMVNMNYIDSFQKKNVVLKTKEILPLSTLKREEIIFHFNQFLAQSTTI